MKTRHFVPLSVALLAGATGAVGLAQWELEQLFKQPLTRDLAEEITALSHLNITIENDQRYLMATGYSPDMSMIVLLDKETLGVSAVLDYKGEFRAGADVIKGFGVQSQTRK